MKTRFKMTLCSLLALLLCLCPLTACAGGVDSDQAKVFIGDFFAAVAAEDYETAETYLHPQRPADLEAFLTGIEEKERIDFQAGITIDRYTGFSSTLYDSTVEGATLELTMRATVGDQRVTFIVEIVENEDGYGIYNLNVDL